MPACKKPLVRKDAGPVKVLIAKIEEDRRRCEFISKPLEALGNVVTFLDYQPFGSFIFNLVILGRSSSHPDVIFLVSSGLKGVLVWLRARCLGVPVVLRLGGNPVKDNREDCTFALSQKKPVMWLKAVLNEAASRLLLVRATSIIVVNDHLKQDLLPLLTEKASVHVIPQFCRGDLEAHHNRREIPAKLLSVTNLDYRAKADGVMWLIRELCKHVEQCKRALVFRVAGDGAHLGRVQRYLDSLDIPEPLSIQLLGFVHDVDDLYRDADLFVYYSDHDETPNVLLETKRWGLPVLVNRYEPFQSVIRHRESGVFYNSGREFRVDLEELIVDPNLREHLGRGAQEDYQTTYSFDAACKRLNDALRVIRPES